MTTRLFLMWILAMNHKTKVGNQKEKKLEKCGYHSIKKSGNWTSSQMNLAHYKP
jgi:hypothetical protein